MLDLIRSLMCSGIGIGQLCSPGGLGRGEHLVDDRVVAHHAGDLVAERDDHVAGQGRDVDDHVGLLLGGADQRVGQDQAALGVGVEHLDRGAVAHGEYVAGAHRRAGRACSPPSPCTPSP